MSKPDDIPQDVWGAADVIFHNVSNENLREAIARAIMAAKVEEREACLRDVFDSTDYLHDERDHFIKDEIADAIRNRKSP